MSSVTWGSRKEEEKGTAALLFLLALHGSWYLFQPDLRGDSIRNLHSTRTVHIVVGFGHLPADQGRHVDSGSWADGGPAP